VDLRALLRMVLFRVGKGLNAKDALKHFEKEIIGRDMMMKKGKRF
jgi:hypothetical protein